ASGDHRPGRGGGAWGPSIEPGRPGAAGQERVAPNERGPLDQPAGPSPEHARVRVVTRAPRVQFRLAQTKPASDAGVGLPLELALVIGRLGQDRDLAGAVAEAALVPDGGPAPGGRDQEATWEGSHARHTSAGKEPRRPSL